MEKRSQQWDFLWLTLIAGMCVWLIYSCQPTESPVNIRPTDTPLAWVTTTSTPTADPTATNTPTPKPTPSPPLAPAPTETPFPTARPTATKTAVIVTPEPTPTATSRMYALLHEVQPGQWLSTIAAHYYGGEWQRWPEIVQITNRAAPNFTGGCMRVIDDPDLIFPGDCLLVPIKANYGN